MKLEVQLTYFWIQQKFKFTNYNFFLFLGGVSASAESINYILGSKEKGKAAVLMVGGAAESLYCKPGTYRIVLKKRKGFVKLALKNGFVKNLYYSYIYQIKNYHMQ